jgi:hypothetical protein
MTLGAPWRPDWRLTMVGILWFILAVVLAIWLVGLLANFAGNIIHVLLIVALAILIYNLLTGRRTVA